MGSSSSSSSVTRSGSRRVLTANSVSAAIHSPHEARSGSAARRSDHRQCEGAQVLQRHDASLQARTFDLVFLLTIAAVKLFAETIEAHFPAVGSADHGGVHQQALPCRGRARFLVLRQLTEREVLGEARGREALFGAMQQGEKAAARRHRAGANRVCSGPECRRGANLPPPAAGSVPESGPGSQSGRTARRVPPPRRSGAQSLRTPGPRRRSRRSRRCRRNRAAGEPPQRTGIAGAIRETTAAALRPRRGAGRDGRERYSARG